MPVFVTLFFVGVVLLMGFLPPHSPSAGPEEIAAIFRDNTTQIRFGVTVCSYAVILLAPWGIAVAMQAARAERGRPVLAITQISALSMGAFTGVLDMTVWAVAAYRPHETDADIVRLLNDFGWILFVWVIPTFTLWEIALGLAILLDKSETPAFPKWAGWFTLWIPFVSSPSSIVLFFYGGPFAWNGIPFWLTFSMFFAWMFVMHVLLIKAINKQTRGDQVHTGDGAAIPDGTVSEPLTNV